MLLFFTFFHSTPNIIVDHKTLKFFFLIYTKKMYECTKLFKFLLLRHQQPIRGYITVHHNSFSSLRVAVIVLLLLTAATIEID